MNKPDKRISALIEEVRGDILADIGCDHGYCAVGALLCGKAERVYAVDISADSLEKTRVLSEQTGVADRVVCLKGDGFAPIEVRADTAIIAGMGGIEIVSILSAAKKLPVRLVLCPHQNAYELRKYVSGKFSIEKDFAVASGGKFYQIIVLSEGADEYTEGEFFFGKNMPSTEDYKDMISARRAVLEERFGRMQIPSGKLRAEYEEVKAGCLKLKI